MSLGNGNPKDGDKGSNFNYELKVLQGLQAIAVALEAGNHVYLTYSELYALYNARAFVPGRFYTITDFEVIYNVPTYNMLGDVYYDTENMPVRNTGGYSLTVQAFTNSLLYPSAFSMERPGVYFEYDITANRTVFDNEDAKGKITRYVNTYTGNSGYTDLEYVQYGRFSTYVSTGSPFTGTGFTVSFNDGSGTGHIECNDANALFNSEIAVGSIINLGGPGDGSNYGNVYVEQIITDNYLTFTAETGIGGTDYTTIYSSELISELLSWKETYIGQFARDGFYDYYTSIGNSGNCTNTTLGKCDIDNPFQLDNNVIGIRSDPATDITLGMGSTNNTIHYGSNVNILFADGNDFGSNVSNVNITGNVINNMFTGIQDCNISASMYENTITSDFYDNSIAGRFFFNRIRTPFYKNTINCINGFNNNTFNTKCAYNNITCKEMVGNTCDTFGENVILSGSVTDNSFGTEFIGNVIASNREGLSSNTFGKGVSFNYFLDFINNTFGSTGCNNNIFQCTVDSLDFTSATIIADTGYSKTVMQKSGGGAPTLWYLDATNTPQYDTVTA